MDIRLSYVFLLILVLAAGRPASAQISTSQSETAEVSDVVETHRTLGDSLRMAGDLSATIGAYRIAYDATKDSFRAGEDGIAYALATTLALKGDEPDEAFKYLTESLSGMTSMKVLHDPDLYFLVRDERWKEVEDTMLDRLATEVSGIFDRNLARSLLNMKRDFGGGM